MTDQVNLNSKEIVMHCKLWVKNWWRCLKESFKNLIYQRLEEAIYEARRLKSREAKRRHLQYIGKLMRISDIGDIQTTLDKMDHQSLTYRQHFAALEQWRDRLINGGNTAIDEFVNDHSLADRQKLRNLQRQANREHELKKPPVASRKLFAYIRSLAE